MSRCSALLATLIVVAASLGACAPKFVVRHDAPEFGVVLIRVDDELAGFLDRGKRLSVRLSRGLHEVEAMPLGRERNPWLDDGGAWTIFVDHTAELTLFSPPSPSP